MRPFLTPLAVCVVLALAACSKSKTASSPAVNRDACSLLTGQEIEAIQGAAPQETKSSGKSDLGLTVSQCSFLLPKAADSIVLTLTERAGSPDARDPKQSWEETFHGDPENGKAGEKGKDARRLQNISGLGDEAFWSPHRFGGVLYVLHGNRSISISVGGATDPATKLEKSKSLAAMVLKRL